MMILTQWINALLISDFIVSLIRLFKLNSDMAMRLYLETRVTANTDL